MDKKLYSQNFDGETFIKWQSGSQEGLGRVALKMM
jgi:hypothetical protein